MNLQLRVSKGQSVLSAAPQHAPPHSFKSIPPPLELNHVAQPAVQHSSSASMYVPESGAEAAEETHGLEEGLIFVSCPSYLCSFLVSPSCTILDILADGYALFLACLVSVYF